MNRRVADIVRRLLRFPLAAKLAGANAILLLVAIGGFRSVHHGSVAWPALAIAGVVLIAGIAANVTLVTLALGPLRDLESTAQRVWRGDLDARVPSSLVADRELERVSNTFNLLLDRVMAERARIRELAAQVIRVGDRERAAFAGELHDSTAQAIAALSYQLIAAERMSKDPAVTARLTAAREATSAILEEVRVLSYTVYPRILHDLGLASALRDLARTMAVDIGPAIDVDITDAAESIVRRMPLESAAVLYRVAQESVRNALLHSKATRIIIGLDSAESALTLRVVDDGIGFDPEQVERGSAGMGLFTMRERVSLADGHFDLVTRLGRGTTVIASIPAGLAAAISRSASH